MITTKLSAKAPMKTSTRSSTISSTASLGIDQSRPKIGELTEDMTENAIFEKDMIHQVDKINYTDFIFKNNFEIHHKEEMMTN